MDSQLETARLNPPAPQSATLPAATIVIEWENAIDVDDEWAGRAVAGLARELAETAASLPSPPVVNYLFDRTAVTPDTIRQIIDQAAPDLGQHCTLELVPTDGLSYYELKNYGAARATTEISVFLDSDAAPRPGWLRAMLTPFADQAVVAVGGITVLAYEDFFSRSLALSWIFGLEGERHRTSRQWGIYANNTAVRTAFFNDHPFPKLSTYKYQCVFWLRAILDQGRGYVRAPDALTIHAPHPGYRFLAWRAWITGLDRDFYVFHARSRSRVRRGMKALGFFTARTARTWWRIAAKRGAVGLPAWQVPGAMAVALIYNGGVLGGQLWSAATRDQDELPTI